MLWGILFRKSVTSIAGHIGLNCNMTYIGDGGHVELCCVVTTICINTDFNKFL